MSLSGPQLLSGKKNAAQNSIFSLSEANTLRKYATLNERTMLHKIRASQFSQFELITQR